MNLLQAQWQGMVLGATGAIVGLTFWQVRDKGRPWMRVLRIAAALLLILTAAVFVDRLERYCDFGSDGPRSLPAAAPGKEGVSHG